MQNNSKLSSWKEISDYLKIRVRTAQRWEKNLDLPVRRVSGSPGTYVYAYKEELDRWLEEKDSLEKIKDRGQSLESSILRKNKIVIIFIVIFIAVSLAVLSTVVSLNKGDPIPAQFKLKGRQLIINNERGKELWRFELDVVPEPSYYQRDLSTFRSTDHRNVYFSDINNDNYCDVLFTLNTADHMHESVLCISHKGDFLWELKPGRRLKFETHIISSDFHIHSLMPIDLDSDGIKEIVIISRHKLFFPSQVLIVNPSGEIIGEYWNIGHINCVQYFDVDKDGIKEIILGGINNAFQKACLMMLDIRAVRGASPKCENAKYTSEELDGGTEEYYVLFPKDEIGSLIGLPDSIYALDFLDDNRFIAWTNFSKLGYIFDFSLKPVDLYLGDQFMKKFNEMKNQNKISVPLGFYKQKTLLKEIIYWDGKKWIDKPTMTDYWKEKSLKPK